MGVNLGCIDVLILVLSVFRLLDCSYGVGIEFWG